MMIIMSKKHLLQKRFTVAASLILLGSAAFVFRDKLCQPTQAFCHQSTAEIPANSSQLAPNYFSYSDQKLDKLLARNQKIVLYFWAPWCTSCTLLDQDILDGKVQIPNGVSLLRVPYDTAQELKQKYKVVVQHTFVEVDKNKEPIKTWVGGGIEELKTL
jgi:thiol:disulfide interchange protein